MMRICDKNKCTGCWACVNACPKGCIEMKEGKLLHLFPAIDSNACIDCGLCQKVCPAINPVIKKAPSMVYAAWAKDVAEYTTSTSGGIASVLARQIIINGGIVYGCAYRDNEFKHIRIDNEYELGLLKGSKYVQSAIYGTYKSCKKDLADNKNVMYVGTPCQIAGLKNYLKNDYDNLLLVDLICHGVPSSGLLKRHIKKITGRENVDGIEFRQGKKMSIILTDKGEELYKSNLWKQRYHDAYYNMFIDGYSYRPSCHDCQFAESNRVSDITLGDFWGLKDDIAVPHTEGVSCVLVNTEKGKSHMDCITDDINLFQRELNEAVAGNDQLRQPKKTGRRIRLFLLLADIIGYDHAYKLCELDHIVRFRKLKQND